MTGITELAQSLKAAAEKATPGRWEYYPGNTSIEYNVDSMDEDQGSIVYVDSGDFTQAQTDRNGEFIALANPASILALVEALEKAQQRISQLESRTVTVKQGEVLVTVAGFTGCGKSAIAGEIEIAMKAIGLPVTWANGDSEKRMTGADWLTAIEMYKPTVRIVEVNIPRAAGIKVEAE
ncbi:TPA: ead/Ea22-like family protein [Klebsiella pneumoniae]|uniref:ead/Ea22-like family protein n=1 Tax=Klebsiella pneumoniae TaxID=573 RepID=UPI001E2AD3AC|nr:ead/Ea22-like family protein [Klebsiella pneumoniae]ELS6340888.1 ead/Ea22-like family protein [Klebsiella pneumoniae]ELS6350529.1 ead/Ea22-like family protein [Klebsiella pneumoniae]MCD5610780.1 ead/Ea22-like family protein [Klebsiella pneumoniae]MCD5695636.1 ead/Ea22-like family protein [Klebsiella pneumoniae]UGL91982.1 ead/Ea22-like family protein [Klebsiella pneumoniae]